MFSEFLKMQMAPQAVSGPNSQSNPATQSSALQGREAETRRLAPKAQRQSMGSERTFGVPIMPEQRQQSADAARDISGPIRNEVSNRRSKHLAFAASQGCGPREPLTTSNPPREGSKLKRRRVPGSPLEPDSYKKTRRSERLSNTDWQTTPASGGVDLVHLQNPEQFSRSPDQLADELEHKRRVAEELTRQLEDTLALGRALMAGE
jgi:hypothetical protein